MTGVEQARVLRTSMVDIDTLRPHPDNPRRGNMDRIEQSLRQNGQYAPLIVHDGSGFILAGNHRWRVLRERLGATQVLATFVSCPDITARAILAADNRTSDDAGYDEASLLALLRTLDEGDALPASGYELDDLDDLVARLDETAYSSDLSDSDEEAEPDAPGATPPYLEGGDRFEPTLRDGREDYDASKTRSIVLILDGDAYVDFVAHLEQLQEVYGTTTYTETIVACVELAAEEDGECELSSSAES